VNNLLGEEKELEKSVLSLEKVSPASQDDDDDDDDDQSPAMDVLYE